MQPRLNFRQQCHVPLTQTVSIASLSLLKAMRFAVRPGIASSSASTLKKHNFTHLKNISDKSAMAISSGSGVNNGKLHDLILQPTEITKTVIDFKTTNLPEYKGLYATVLDNVFTEQACQTLINMAESTTGGEWEEAMVNVGNGKQRTIKDTRDCGRIIWDDFDMVATIWARIKDQVPEIHTLKNQSHITGYGPVKRNETWKMSRLNERMRFLKYQEDQYFRRKDNYAFPSPLQNMNLTCAFQRTRMAPM